jgi:DNA primase
MQETWKTELTPEQRTEALDKVIQLCHANLFSGNSKVLNYLRDRGIYDATSRVFNLGAFPRDPNVLVRFVGKDVLFKLRMISVNKETREIVSKFNTHELIIPIYDVHGKAVALMGRCLLSPEAMEAEGLPKYTNTSFKKSKCLFGLNLTKDFIRAKKKCFVVEGNFDVITAYQNGMKNVAASSGTFLSKHQFLLLARYVDDVRILFDNDDAGKEASSKILKKYNYDAVKIKAARLPSNVKDLDEYFQAKRKQGE